MFKKLTLEEQLKEERQRNLALQARQEEMEEMMLETLVDLEFRQSMSEMGL